MAEFMRGKRNNNPPKKTMGKNARPSTHTGQTESVYGVKLPDSIEQLDHSTVMLLQRTYGNRQTEHILRRHYDTQQAPMVQRMIMTDKQFEKSIKGFSFRRSKEMRAVQNALMIYNQSTNDPLEERIEKINNLLITALSWKKTKDDSDKGKKGKEPRNIQAIDALVTQAEEEQKILLSQQQKTPDLSQTEGVHTSPSQVFESVTKATGNEQNDIETPPVDPIKTDQDLVAFKKRLEDIPTLNTPAFIGMIERYAAAIKTSDQQQVDAIIEQIVQYLKDRRAFQVKQELYTDITANSSDLPRAMTEAASKEAEAMNLWSKLTALPPFARIKSQGKGISLESSVAGSLFDGLSFGVPRGNNLLAQQWKKISQNFAVNMRGVVHAMVLEGIDPTSVLATTEWDVIKEKLNNHQVEAFIIHIYDAPKNEPVMDENGEMVYTGQIVPVKHRWVLSPADWNKKNLPFIDPEDANYRKKQNAVYQRYKEITETRLQEIDTG